MYADRMTARSRSAFPGIENAPGADLFTNSMRARRLNHVVPFASRPGVPDSSGKGDLPTWRQFSCLTSKEFQGDSPRALPRRKALVTVGLARAQ